MTSGHVAFRRRQCISQTLGIISSWGCCTGRCKGGERSCRSVHERPSTPEGTCIETALCRAAIPSGATAGIYEALGLRDKDKDHPMGKGVLQTVAMLNDITAPKLIGVDVTDLVGSTS